MGPHFAIRIYDFLEVNAITSATNNRNGGTVNLKQIPRTKDTKGSGRMSHMSFKDELNTIGEKLLKKFQGLPKADISEIAFFFVIVLFIATVIVMMIIACSYCCFNCGHGSLDPKGRKTRVRPSRP